MHLFFSKNIKKEKQTLSVDESNHCLLSLRKKINDKILLTEGKGIIYSATISSIKNKQIQYDNLTVISKQTNKPKIHIAIAPTKNKNRFEWFLEKSTEIGVDVISPLICQNSERKTINHQRCEKVLVAAMKQSQGSILPIFHKLTRFSDFLKTIGNNTYIAHCQNTKKVDLKTILLKNGDLQRSITILIGPEGDFSTEEIISSENIGVKSINLSDKRLRTETAAIVACNMVQILL